MNAAQIEALVDALVKAASAPRGWEWGVTHPECLNTSVAYMVAGNECWTKERALECAFALARARGLPVKFVPWNVPGRDPVMGVQPTVTIRQRLVGSWSNGYASYSNKPITEWTFSNPISPKLAQDAAAGIIFIDVPEGD